MMEIKDIIQIGAITGLMISLGISATIGFKDATVGVMCVSGFLAILGVTKLSSNSDNSIA